MKHAAAGDHPSSSAGLFEPVKLSHDRATTVNVAVSFTIANTIGTRFTGDRIVKCPPECWSEQW